MLLTTDLTRITLPLARGIESLFGTRDENIRLLEKNLGIRTRLLSDSMEIEGDADGVARANRILDDYFSLINEGHVFNNGDLNSYLRVVTGDAETTLRGLVASDDWIRKATLVDQVLLGYSQSWALFRMLMEEEPDKLKAYLKTIHERRTPDRRLADFAVAFGTDFAKLERRYQGFMRTIAKNEAK